MAIRKTVFAIDEYFHIYNRGVEKRIIFNNDAGKHRFSKLLYLCNGSNPFKFDELEKGNEYFFDRGEPIVDICAYCLMDNHFHLLLKEIKDGGITSFMHRLGGSYSSYFNILNERSGALFGGKFLAKHASEDNYLQYLIAYLCLNPVKMIEPKWKEVGIKDAERAKIFLERYRFSSFLDFLGKNRVENRIINVNSLPEYFADKKEFNDYLDDWLRFKDEDEISLGKA